MPNNVYNFARTKRAEPKPLKRIGGLMPKPYSPHYFAGLVLLSVLVGFVTVRVWPKLSAAVTEPVSVLSSDTVRVIDGDTINLGDGQPNVRLVGFNAPETGERALCDAERHKGEAAKRRLRELVSSGSPAFQQIACSCKSGTEGTHACNFGRRCGALQVHGVDVGATLISEGLAVRFVCSATSCPKLPRPWC
jgi:endonuclease YncB( thermonuclease family)